MDDAVMSDASTSSQDGAAEPEPVSGPSSGNHSRPASSSAAQRTAPARPRPVGMCSYGQRLGFAYFDSSPAPDAYELNAASTHTHFFTIDNALVYLSFFKDWGPLHCASFYRFSLHLHSLLEDQNLAGKKIILYSSSDYDKKANAALLMALYAMIVLRWTPAEALHPISDLEVRPFRDAGYARADFNLSLQDCLFGIKKAVDLRLLKLDEFDVREYETFEKVENGDWNLITPHFLAFASPIETSWAAPAAEAAASPSSKQLPVPPLTAPDKLPKTFRMVLDQFKAKNVKTVIRLNKKLYNAQHFTDRNIRHVEMFYEDGTNPTLEQCREFIDIADQTITQGGVVAVHCKAGLGRTGTLIGAYMIYKWGFTASEAIAFQRFMRPGCVVGPQQHYLYANQHTWVRWAALDAAQASRKARSPIPASPSLVTNSQTQAPAASTSYQAVDLPATSAEARLSAQAEPHEVAARSATPPPQTEGHPGAPVPGQPRKTPGAKSRHGIALPETNDVNQQADESEAIMVAANTRQQQHQHQHQHHQGQRQKEDVMQVDGSAAPRAPSEAVEMEVDETPPSPPRPASARPASRIARAKAPLTTNLDNRVPAGNSSTAPAPSGNVKANGTTNPNVPRSKAAKNLGVLGNGNSKPSTLANGQSSERYNLRQASRGQSEAPANGAATGGRATAQRAARSTRPAPPDHGPGSPSRLPTRPNNKRKGAVSPSAPSGPAVKQKPLQHVNDVFTDTNSHSHQQQQQSPQKGSNTKMTRLRKRSIDKAVKASA